MMLHSFGYAMERPENQLQKILNDHHNNPTAALTRLYLSQYTTDMQAHKRIATTFKNLWPTSLCAQLKLHPNAHSWLAKKIAYLMHHNHLTPTDMLVNFLKYYPHKPYNLSLETIRILFDIGAESAIHDENGDTILMMACKKYIHDDNYIGRLQSEEIVTFLLQQPEMRAEILNARNNNQETVLTDNMGFGQSHLGVLIAQHPEVDVNMRSGRTNESPLSILINRASEYCGSLASSDKWGIWHYQQIKTFLNRRSRHHQRDVFIDDTSWNLVHGWTLGSKKILALFEEHLRNQEHDQREALISLRAGLVFARKKCARLTH